MGPIVGSVLNWIPLLLIHYSGSLKQQVEAELQKRRETESSVSEAALHE